jgi:hypothetical protein
MEYGEKHWKTWKIKKMHTVGPQYARKLTKMENKTQTLYDLEYGKKKKKLKNVKNKKYTV